MHLVRVAMLVMNPCVTDSRVRNEAWSLGKAGYDVRVFALADESTPMTSQEDGYTIERLRVRGMASAAWLPWPVRKALIRRAYSKRATTALVHWKPSVIHCHDLETLAVGAASSRDLGSGLVYDSHELWRHRQASGVLRSIGQAFDGITERRLVTEADLTVTVSQGIADWFSTIYGVEPLVVRNVPRKARNDSPGPIQTLAGLSSDARVIAYTGRPIPHRGIEAVIAALPLLEMRLQLVIIGPSTEAERVRILELAEGFGVADRLHFVAPVGPDEVVSALRGATCAMAMTEPTCLSHRLSLPNKFFQAVQAGVPVLVRRELSEIASLAQHESLGVVVDNDPVTIARAAKSIAASENSEVRDLDRYTWEREAKQFVQAYLARWPSQSSGVETLADK